MNASGQGSGGASATGTAVTEARMEFAELVCGDPDLLRQEFDELIAASWDGPPPDRPPSPPRRPAPLGRRGHRRTVRRAGPAARIGATGAAPRERGPPRLWAA